MKRRVQRAPQKQTQTSFRRQRILELDYSRKRPRDAESSTEGGKGWGKRVKAENDLVRTAFALGQLSHLKDSEDQTASEASSDSEQLSPSSWNSAALMTPQRREVDLSRIEADLLSSALALGALRHSAATY